MKEFRAYLEEWNGKFYYFAKVRAFNTREEMQQDIDKMGFGPALDCHGQSSGHAIYKNSNGKLRLSGQIATIWLNKYDLNRNGQEIVTHECVHTAMRHICNKGVDLSNMAGEEALAYCTGSMARQINDRLHKLKIYE